jgi:hypothetical protein
MGGWHTRMNDAAILVLNLTFLVTLGVAFLMFLGNVVLGTVILLFAGAGHVLAFVVLLPFGRYRKNKARALTLSSRQRIFAPPNNSEEGWILAICCFVSSVCSFSSAFSSGRRGFLKLSAHGPGVALHGQCRSEFEAENLFQECSNTVSPR